MPVGNPDIFFSIANQNRIFVTFGCVGNDPKANLSCSSIHLDMAFACFLRFKRGQLFQNAYSTSKSVDCLGELVLKTMNSRLSKKAGLQTSPDFVARSATSQPKKLAPLTKKLVRPTCSKSR